MASNEGQFQTEIQDAFKEVGARVTKVSDQFKGGIPDLNITYKGINAWLELKFQKALPIRADTLLRPDLSKGQKMFMQREQKNGGVALWLLCVKDGLTWRLYLGDTTNDEGVEQGQTIQTRKRGEKWNVENLWDFVSDYK